MKILVTGGAGFIGSHLVDALIAKGHQVMILDDFSAGNKKFVSPRVKVSRVDIRQAEKVEAVFKSFKPRAVFHLAAMVDVRVSLKEPIQDYLVNVHGSMNILEACRKHKIKKLIFSSSGGAIYGDNNHLPLKETEVPRPISPYGVAKKVFEDYARVYRELYGLSVICLRYPNVYGPRQGAVGEAGVVAIFCKRLLANKPLIIFGSGKQTRDFIFVQDVVESNVKALECNKSWVVGNVSTQLETDINEIAKKLLKISGIKVAIRRQSAIPGEVKRNVLSNALIKRELGWSPKISLDEGLKRTWKWFEENY